MRRFRLDVGQLPGFEGAKSDGEPTARRRLLEYDVFGGAPMREGFTAVVQKRGSWWIGWIAEFPGVNSQEATREELLGSLASALEEALEMNRAEARSSAVGSYEEVLIPV